MAASVPVASFALGGTVLLVVTGSGLSAGRVVAPRLGLSWALVETVYALVGPLLFLAAPLLLRRQRARGGWPFRVEWAWTDARALPWAAALAGGAVGLYSGLFAHLRVGGDSWSIGVSWALLVPLSVLLMAFVPGLPRAGASVLLFCVLCEAGSKLGLHLGLRPQDLTPSEASLHVVHVGLFAVLVAAAVRRARETGADRRRLALGLAVTTLVLLASLSALVDQVGPVAKQRRSQARLVADEVLPFIRAELPALISTTQEPAWGGQSDILHLDVEPPPKPWRRPPALILAQLDSFDARPPHGEVDGFRFTDTTGAVYVTGSTRGADGTLYRVRLLWVDDHWPEQPTGRPTLDTVLPR